MINETVGKYKITRLIGEGGMASVYEAEHEMLGTKVAIKVLNPILSANAQIRERFKNEAKMMASFNHPNITKIIDFDDQPHQLSIVMEFLEGEDLNEKIKRNGPLSQDALKDIFTQTLSAFQYAHEKGVIHRDIKPSNIYVLPNGHVKILDFGIAKLFGQGNEMTQTGTQMGTPIYMSPEQVRADKSIDHRSDIYSLGVTMYFAITGKPPYNADTTSQFDIFNKIVFEPLPELPDVGNFDDFVKKACQKDRDQRFQSCEEWVNEFSNSLKNISSMEKAEIHLTNLNEPLKIKESESKPISQEANSSIESTSILNLEVKVKPPNFLKVLCILTWVGSGIDLISLFYMKFFTIFYETSFMFMTLFNITSCVFGSILMWKLNKKGFYLYLISYIVIYVFSYFTIHNLFIWDIKAYIAWWLFGFASTNFLWILSISPLVFSIMYALNLKHMK